MSQKNVRYQRRQRRSQCRISLTDCCFIFGYRPIQLRDISTAAPTKHHSQWWSPSEICFFRNTHASSRILGRTFWVFLPNISKLFSNFVYNVTTITFILKPHLKHNEIVFPVGKNCPGRESVAAPLNILNICFQRKQKQFSNFHQTRHIKNMTSRGDEYQQFIFIFLFEDWIQKWHFWNEPNIRFCIEDKKTL